MAQKFKLSLFLCFLFLAHLSGATHIIAIDAYATCIAKDSSGIELKLNYSQLRDAQASSVPFDNEIDVGIYNKTSKSLVKRVTIQLVKESINYVPQAGSFALRVGDYEGSVNLPPSQEGYIILYGRCCIVASQNLPQDIGTAVLIEIPGSINVGDHTLKRDDFGILVMQTNTLKTFDFPWYSSLYDSITFKSDKYYLYGDKNDPVPNPPINFPNFAEGVFMNGGSPGDPFGTAGQFTKTDDLHYSILLKNLGRYFYPISTTLYLQGDSFVSTRLLPLYVLSYVPPVLDIELTKNANGIAQFNGYSDAWNYPGTIAFQRSDGKNPYSFQTLESNISDGFAFPLIDSNVAQSITYYYRLERTGSGNTAYSDTISLQYKVGFKDFKVTPSLKIYPNPASSLIILEGEQMGQFEIIDLLGKTWISGIKYEAIETLNSSSLPGGMYFVKFQNQILRLMITEKY